MSRDQSERQYNGKQKAPAKPAAKATRLYVFRPTVAERQVISTTWEDTGRNLTVISDYLESGCKLNLGYAPTTNSFFASLRGPAEDWREAPTITVYHAQPARLLAMLAYVLQEKVLEFPEKLPSIANPDEWDW